MADTKDLVEYRKRAYHFAKSLVAGVSWVDRNHSLDEDLADILDVKLSDLILLKQGKVNPSTKLVKSLKTSFCDDSDTATQIEQVLVDPFK